MFKGKANVQTVFPVPYSCAKSNHKKGEPLLTLQNLQWKVVSYILQLNSLSKVLPNHWQTG